MKRFLLLSICCLAYLFSSAQLNERQLSQLEKEIGLEPQPVESKKNGLVNDWYMWSADFAAFEGGFRSHSSFFALYPDTFVKNVFLDDNTNATVVSYQAWSSVGLGFDPIDKRWNDANLPALKQYTGYFLDSVSVQYGYFRTNADTSIVDTAIIQVFKTENNQLKKGTHSSHKGLFAVPKIDRNTGRGSNFFTEIKVPLVERDETPLSKEGTFIRKNLQVKLEKGSNRIWLRSDQQAHVTVSFKPGQNYSRGDTVFFDDDLLDWGVTPPLKKFNRFGVIVRTQSPNTTPLESYNNGSFVTKWNRYVDTTHDTSFAKGYYHPERFDEGRTSFAHYPNIVYKVSAALSINDDRPVNALNMNVYPNPTTSTLLLEYGNTKDALTTYSIHDLTGRTVISESLGVQKAGSHQERIDVGAMNPGVYMLHFTSGNETITRQIVKQ